MLVTMKLPKLLLTTLLVTFAGCAGQTYRAELGPMFAHARGTLALANSQQQMQPDNGVNGDLGLGHTEASPYVRFRTDFEKHRVRFNGFYLDSKGSGTLSNAYGDIPAGNQVQTSLDFLALASNYTYEVLRGEDYRVGLGGQLGFYSLDAGVSTLATREKVSTEVIVPMPYVEVEGLWDEFRAGISMGLMSADLGDANGRYIDLEAYVNYVDDNYDVKLGYRYLLLDGYGRASSRDFDADVDVQGLFLTAGLCF